MAAAKKAVSRFQTLRNWKLIFKKRELIIVYWLLANNSILFY